MSMQLDLYSTTADPRKVNKPLNGVSSGVRLLNPTEGLNLITPTFIISYDPNFLQANYCYCSVFNRYYFIDPYILLPGKRMALPCRVDVRMSWGNYIKGSCAATVVRSESIGKPTLIPDNSLPIIPGKTEIITQTFGEDRFQTNATESYVLTVLRV